ncbi:MAG: riboflavin biosynthesis protein RibF [Acidobacteriaceae bacterium]
MQIYRSLSELGSSPSPSVVTVGNFDGVHCGHQMVIASLLERARAYQARACAITFDPHPAQVLHPHSPLRLITPLEQKLKLLAETGLDSVLVLPFTNEVRHWTAFHFAQYVLHQGFHALEVHEGENFRFGYQAQSDVTGLAEMGNKLGFAVRSYVPRIARGAPISSSRIRTAISAGRLQEARALLGRPFFLVSTPAPGRGYGSRYAVPTINLAPYADLLPANGVYITTLRIGNQRIFRAVTNIGNRPTFGADSFAVESHLLDYEPMDLNENTPLKITFLRRLRDERPFPSPAALRDQIHLDVQRALRYFSLAEALRLPIPPK